MAKNQNFIGTRGEDLSVDSIKNVDFKSALLSPSADFGGLFSPSFIPHFEEAQLKEFSKMPYKTFAKALFLELGLNIEQEILENALNLYDNFDDKQNPAPLMLLDSALAGDCAYLQKLYCGPTRAFKDMALQPFGAVFAGFLQEDSNKDKNYLVLAATSGDTGPATLASFARRKNIRVCCLYPDGGTSDVQRLQMTTQDAPNLLVLGVRGDFDDAQNALKNLLKDNEFKERLNHTNTALSAANSVNFGRIAFQIIYHAYSSLQIWEKYHKKAHIIVPSGNFGNALGAFYALKMGFFIERIYIASNANSVLCDFIERGEYDLRNRTLQKTISPAMDILKSSNVERLLFANFGAKRTKELMESLEKTSHYALNEAEIKEIKKIFSACFCDDEKCSKIIAKAAQSGVIIDPHTACGLALAQSLEIPKNAPKIFCSTAEWTKFAPNIAKAIGLGEKNLSDKDALNLISGRFNTPLPASICELFSKCENHTKIIDKTQIKSEILAWLSK